MWSVIMWSIIYDLEDFWKKAALMNCIGNYKYLFDIPYLVRMFDGRDQGTFVALFPGHIIFGFSCVEKDSGVEKSPINPTWR